MIRKRLFSDVRCAHCTLLGLQDFRLNLHGRILCNDLSLPAGSPAGCVMSVHVLITEVSVLSARSFCWSWPCLPRCLHSRVDNSPYSSWGAVLHFSCNLLLPLASNRCLTSRRHQSCHLHFTLTSSFSPHPSKACCPTSNLSPCLDNSPLLPPSCSKSMISN